MKNFFPILIIAFLVYGSLCFGKESNTRIIICIPTIEQEATSIWRTINDIAFFEKQGYSVNLPKDELIDSLVLKSKNGTFGNKDFSLIYDLLESKYYNKSNYQVALEKVQKQEQLINNIILQLEDFKQLFDWNFSTHQQYNIAFTLYGSGGSYDCNTATITLFTTIKGDFMKYKNPANTIIHEIVHIGLEKSIVQKYNLSHGTKERLVDTFVFLMFGELLPDYQVQNMGDSWLDS